VNWRWLRESREELGFDPPAVNPRNVFGEGPQVVARFADVLRPLLRDRTFWMVCVLSLGCTLLRETFNTWMPTYFHQSVGYSIGDAAAMSALFPFVGGVSVVILGLLGDHLGSTGREWVMVVGLTTVTLALFALSTMSDHSGSWAIVGAVLLIAFTLLGPYSYLAGAVALDFGGAGGSATASAIIDGVGYLGGVLAGDSVARISVAWGWDGAFRALAAVAALSAIAAITLLVLRRRPALGDSSPAG